MSTPRKRTKAEAERVRQINLLARLWQSKALADGLLSGRSTVPARGFAVWLQQYTQAFLHDGLKRRGSQQINRTKLAGYITSLGANRRRQGESPVLMAEAVIATRALVGRRQAVKELSNPLNKLPVDERQRLATLYKRTAERIIARAFRPIAGWERLAWAFHDRVWLTMENLHKTLDELAAEQAKTLDKRP